MSLDTIFALSSGAPPAAIAIIRISGPQACSIAASLGAANLLPRYAHLRVLRDRAGELLDQAIVIFFPGPTSATGEDLVEVHAHGGRAVVQAIGHAIEMAGDVRRALPGEFTRRAVANGRLDLFDVEALGDLLAAETEEQRRRAQCSAPFLRTWTDEISQELLSLSAAIEAELDYEGEDGGAGAGWAASLQTLANEIAGRLERPSAERLRDGFLVVLAGPANAGKSSLFNALVGRRSAIVSPEEGTTRDVLEASIAFGDIPVRLFDTAGLRESDNVVEAEGVRRASDLCQTADLVLWLGTEPYPFSSPAIIVAAKADVEPERSGLSVSAVTGTGLGDLVDRIREMLASKLVPPSEGLLHERHRLVLGELRDALREAAESIDMVVSAELLRSARLKIDELTGRAGTEDMLDTLFARFCLGK